MIILKRRSLRNGLVLLVGSITALFASPSIAQERALVRTASGCSVFSSEAVQQQSKVEVTWDGACESGLAEGQGVLVHTFTTGDHVAVKTRHLTMRRGSAFGYAKGNMRQTAIAIFPASNVTFWEFATVSRTVHFNGLGLEGSDRLLGQYDLLPTRTSKLTSGTYLDDGVSKRVGSVRQISGEGTLLTSVQIGAGGKLDFAGMEKFPCPNPNDLASCAPLAATLIAPLVEEIENFIRISLPALRDCSKRPPSSGSFC